MTVAYDQRHQAIDSTPWSWVVGRHQHHCQGMGGQGQRSLCAPTQILEPGLKAWQDHWQVFRPQLDPQAPAGSRDGSNGGGVVEGGGDVGGGM